MAAQRTRLNCGNVWKDAWRSPLVLRRWQRFAAQLTLEQTEAVLQRALALGLGGQTVQTHADEQATEGWGLDTAGYEVAPCAPVAHGDARFQALTATGCPSDTVRCHT